MKHGEHLQRVNQFTSLLLVVCALACASGALSATTASRSMVGQADGDTPQIGDYVFCYFSWWPWERSWAGHGAIYVGDRGDGFDVVERDENGVHWQKLSAMQAYYRGVQFATVTTVPLAVRLAAAERARFVATAIEAGQITEDIRWYGEDYALGLYDCISTFIKFYQDAGATAELVGPLGHYILPAGAYTYYREGRTWDQEIWGNGGVISGGSSGGIESRPLWLRRPGAKNQALHTTTPMGAKTEALLRQFIPTAGMNGEVGQPVDPDLTEVSNAIAAAGMNYVDSGSGLVVASILAAETLDAVYEHDYPICARVHGLEIFDMIAAPVDTSWVWVMTGIDNQTQMVEYVIPVVFNLDGTVARQDCRYPADLYGSQITGTVLNYQIRSGCPYQALYLYQQVCQLVAQAYSRVDLNVAEPAPALVIAHTARYAKPNVVLEAENFGPARTVRFFGVVWTEPRAATETPVEFYQEVPAGHSVVSLPVGVIHDAVIYIEAEGFLDKVYVTSGYWFSFDDRGQGGTSTVHMTQGELVHDPIPLAEPELVSPPAATMTGVVTDVCPWGYIGIAYSWTTDRTPVDLSQEGALVFYARGDGGQYRVKLESASVTDSDYHGFNFTASPDWHLVYVPFYRLQQEGWGTPVAWTGSDIRTISLVTTSRPLPSVDLDIDRMAFLPAGISAADQPQLPDVSITRLTPNPFSARLEFSIDIARCVPVSMIIYDVRGRRVRTLADRQPVAPGRWLLSWDGRNESGQRAPAGVYLYRLQAGEQIQEGKVLLQR